MSRFPMSGATRVQLTYGAAGAVIVSEVAKVMPL
jgi:hypothetical protein